MMPPRTTEVGRGFPTFRVRNSITYRYSQSLELSIRRRKPHTLVNDRQVRGASPPRAGTFALPGHRLSLGSRILFTVTQLVTYMFRLPQANHYTQVIVTYSAYAEEWKEVYLLWNFRIIIPPLHIRYFYFCCFSAFFFFYPSNYHLYSFSFLCPAVRVPIIISIPSDTCGSPIIVGLDFSEIRESYLELRRI